MPVNNLQCLIITYLALGKKSFCKVRFALEKAVLKKNIFWLENTPKPSTAH
jgi:hypothetical protein